VVAKRQQKNRIYLSVELLLARRDERESACSAGEDRNWFFHVWRLSGQAYGKET
jgi:hypothetical protein